MDPINTYVEGLQKNLACNLEMLVFRTHIMLESKTLNSINLETPIH